MAKERKGESIRERHERQSRELVGDHNLARGAAGSPTEWITADDDAAAAIRQALADAFWAGVAWERTKAEMEAPE